MLRISEGEGQEGGGMIWQDEVEERLAREKRDGMERLRLVWGEHYRSRLYRIEMPLRAALGRKWGYHMEEIGNDVDAILEIDALLEKRGTLDEGAALTGILNGAWARARSRPEIAPNAIPYVLPGQIGLDNPLRIR